MNKKSPLKPQSFCWPK